MPSPTQLRLLSRRLLFGADGPVEQVIRIWRNDTSRFLMVAALAGLLGGLAGVLFDLLVGQISVLAFGTVEPSAHHHAKDFGALSAAQPAWWLWLLVPALGGLVATALIAVGTGSKGRVGLADVVEGVANEGGRLDLRAAAASAGGAVLSLGTGVSGGREGPIVQLGAALASWLGGVLKLPPQRHRVVAAAGASAGIAASFDAPVGAVFFAMEVLLGSFAMEYFGPVVVATVVGTIVGDALLGDHTQLLLPEFGLVKAWQIALCAVLGVGIGMIGLGFLKGLSMCHSLIERIPLPRWALGLVAGLTTGIVAVLGAPHILGNGYGFLRELLEQPNMAIGFLLVLLVLKMGTALDRKSVV